MEKEIQELRDELARNKISKKMGTLENTAIIPKLRKDIARLLTESNKGKNNGK
jgi:ribosomal protein L29